MVQILEPSKTHLNPVQVASPKWWVTRLRSTYILVPCTTKTYCFVRLKLRLNVQSQACVGVVADTVRQTVGDLTPDYETSMPLSSTLGVQRLSPRPLNPKPFSRNSEAPLESSMPPVLRICAELSRCALPALELYRLLCKSKLRIQSLGL